MRFLSKTGYDLSLLSIKLAHVVRYTLARITGHSGFAGVRIIINDTSTNTVLLVRAWHAPFVWTLPGGGVNKDETLEHAAQREVYEETSLTIRHIDGTVGHYTDRFGERDTVAVFYTSNFSGTLATLHDWEIIERKWFDLSALPQNIALVHRAHIKKYLAGTREEHGSLQDQ